MVHQSTGATRLVPRSAQNRGRHDGLRAEVRAFLRHQLDSGVFAPGVDTWLTGWDPEFSRVLAERGWVGMTVPTEFGGHGRSHVERFVVTEELLAAGAPVAAHWIADRQIAPSLLKYGTKPQKKRFLPAISRAECFFGIGMSEPESGSDLASVRTSAVETEGGWLVSGTKLWTSGAHRADFFFALARTSPRDPQRRHDGLSQFIVDLRADGVEIRPIISTTGQHHFNEVQMEEVFVPADMVLGNIGEGWRQVTSELGYERSGPERFLSTFPLLAATAQAMERDELPTEPEIGRLIARTAGLHHMSSAVASALQRGEDASTAAAVVKTLGTVMEGDIADFADTLGDALGAPLTEGHDGSFQDLLRMAVLQRPGFTLRGGTTEVLRGVISRELGLR